MARAMDYTSKVYGHILNEEYGNAIDILEVSTSNLLCKLKKEKPNS